MITNEKASRSQIVNYLETYAKIRLEPFGKFRNTYIYSITKGMSTFSDFGRVQSIINNQMGKKFPGYRFGFNFGNFKLDNYHYQLIISDK